MPRFEPKLVHVEDLDGIRGSRQREVIWDNLSDEALGGNRAPSIMQVCEGLNRLQAQIDALRTADPAVLHLSNGEGMSRCGFWEKEDAHVGDGITNVESRVTCPRCLCRGE